SSSFPSRPSPTSPLPRRAGRATSRTVVPSGLPVIRKLSFTISLKNGSPRREQFFTPCHVAVALPHQPLFQYPGRKMKHVVREKGVGAVELPRRRSINGF